MKYIIIFSFTLVIFCNFSYAQETKISGTILEDSTSAPLQDVQIINIKSRKSSFTDVSGNFVLYADIGDSIEIGLTGYNTKYLLVNQSDVGKVFLQKSELSLKDVIVTTALGIKRNQNTLPYAVQQLNSDEINRVPSSNFINSLSGKIAGLQITSSNTLGGSTGAVIRGFKSLTQTNQALYVVDGIPFDNTYQNQNGYDLGNVASDINPIDIASVAVLKGAAASALYGSRAANGVILVTTKQGKNSNGKIGITLDEGIKWGYVDNSTMPKYQDRYGQGYGSSGYNANYPDEDGYFYYQPAIGSEGKPVEIVMTDWDLVWGAKYDPNRSVYNWDAFSPVNGNYGKATPWAASKHYKPSYLFQTPLNNITNLYLTAGDEKGGFKTGITNSYERGLLPNSYIKRNLLNLGGHYRFTDKITVTGSIYVVDEDDKNRDSYDFRATNSIVRDFRQWWPTNVDLEEQKQDYFNSKRNITWDWSGGYNSASLDSLPSAAYHNNPYWTLYENYNTASRRRYFGHLGINYEISNHLSLLARVANDYYHQLFETRTAIGSYQTSAYTKYQSTYSETNYDFMLNWNSTIGNKSELKAIAGFNIRKDNISSDYAATNGGLVIADFYALSNSAKTIDPPTEQEINKEIDGIFGNVTYIYNKLITLDVSGRTDKSSTLPASHNTYFYPAVSAGFVFSQLLQNQKWLSYGKLRANYAEVGSDAPAYSLDNTYTAGTSINGQNIFNYTSVNNNPDLKPEKNKSFEIGIQASFVHNRVGADVTYYHAKQIDQIMPVTPSSASGFSEFYVNGGNVQNAGWEVQLNGSPVRNNNFSWDITVNWSKNKNKVLSLYNNQPSYTIATFQNNVLLVAEVGKSYGELRGTDYEYKNGQRLIGDNGLPVKSTNTQSDIGNINPDWIGGINNSFRYKNFILSFLVDFKKGGDVYSLDMDYGGWAGVYAETAANNDLGNPLRNSLADGGGIILSGVDKDGNPNKVRVAADDISKVAHNLPFGSVNALAASSYVYDASYIKLREVQLAYDLPHQWIKKTPVKELQISLSGRNLWIIHKNLPYADPEQGSASTTLTSTAPIVFNQNATTGYQNGVYPNIRQFAFNLRVNF